MKNTHLPAVFLFIMLFCACVFGQKMIVINEPKASAPPLLVSNFETDPIKKSVLPKARKLWSENDACAEDFKITGKARGAFSKPNTNQTLVLYEFCQTGNGFGNNGLVLFENGKIIASYVSEGGWSLDLKSLPDINQNGLNEFAVYYLGGMHHGQGGTGFDIMEFADKTVQGLGWFQAEGFTEDDSFGYKVSVKLGRTLQFYREKYISTGENKWRKSGKIAPFKLGKTYGKFIALK